MSLFSPLTSCRLGDPRYAYDKVQQQHTTTSELYDELVHVTSSPCLSCSATIAATMLLTLKLVPVALNISYRRSGSRRVASEKGMD